MNHEVTTLISILESAGFSHDELAGTLAELNDAVNNDQATSIQLVSPGAAARYIKRINDETIFQARFRHSDEPDLLNNESSDERIENPNQDSCIVISYDPAQH
ncbi:hypothetical protein FEI15_07795 [Lacticaseibacillus zeae]|uniref:Uncharacterized protein n=1 Tax=Lacticaseibacillus zeae TaxID=57037 RepID=A0A5R8LQ26_LACZE|nr:hypothetical protein [Lacticaseibacillus zeae]TLF39347.1 hypothetical protein FEI15_07795 [Lacticaseibacillus zeae]